MILARVRTYGSLVMFTHTVFALPFAATAVVLSRAEQHVALDWRRVLAMLVCMVAARTAAMAFNRWADRNIDAKNPRTAMRDIPAGRVRPGEALALSLGAAAVFVLSAATLGFWPLALSPIVLFVLLGYSYAKRFTWAAHVWLGIALSLAPGGAWIAMGTAPNLGILALMLGVVTWLVGFDVLYSLQDEAFDKKEGLHSIPARFGMRGSLIISALAHVITASAFCASGVLLHRGVFYFVAVFASSALLTYEHVIVGKGDLTKINKAFFDVNAYVSVVYFVLTLTDELRRTNIL